MRQRLESLRLSQSGRRYSVSHSRETILDIDAERGDMDKGYSQKSILTGNSDEVCQGAISCIPHTRMKSTWKCITLAHMCYKFT